MAYTEEAVKRKKPVFGEVGTGGLNTSGVVGAAGSSPEAQAKSSMTPSTGFVNLQQYLDLNQDQGGKVADAYTAGLNKGVDEFNKNTKSTADKTVSDINAQGASYDQAAASAVKDMNETGNISGAQGLVSAAYNPDNSGVLNTISANKKTLGEKLGNANKTSYQQAGLEDLFQNETGDYGKGFGILDRFLMTGSQSGRNKIASTMGRSSELQSSYDKAAAGIKSAEDSTRGKLSSAKDLVRGTARDRRSNLESSYGGRIAGKNAEAAGNVGYSGASLGDVISADEEAYLGALSDLAGVERRTYGKTFNAGRKPEPIQQTDGGGIKGITTADVPGVGNKGADFLAKAGAAISDPSKAVSMRGAQVTAGDLQDQISMNNAAELNAYAMGRTLPSVNRFKIKKRW